MVGEAGRGEAGAGWAPEGGDAGAVLPRIVPGAQAGGQGDAGGPVGVPALVGDARTAGEPDIGLAHPLGRAVLLPVVRGRGQAGPLTVPARADAEASGTASPEARAGRSRGAGASAGALRVRRAARP